MIDQIILYLLLGFFLLCALAMAFFSQNIDRQEALEKNMSREEYQIHKRLVGTFKFAYFVLDLIKRPMFFLFFKNETRIGLLYTALIYYFLFNLAYFKEYLPVMLVAMNHQNIEDSRNVLTEFIFMYSFLFFCSLFLYYLKFIRQAIEPKCDFFNAAIGIILFVGAFGIYNEVTYKMIIFSALWPFFMVGILYLIFSILMKNELLRHSQIEE